MDKRRPAGMNNNEAKFKDWLDKRNYSYLYIDQSTQTFAEFFRNLTKRPDFLVVVNNVGMLAVDTKERDPQPNYIIDETDEIEKYLEFERRVRLPVWFVFGSSKDNYNTWHWISLSKVLECPLKTSSKSGEAFRVIPPSECIVIQHNKDSISRIIE